MAHCDLEKTIKTAFAEFLNSYNIVHVLIRNSILKLGECKKLKPRYKGPYMITKILNKNFK